MLEHLVLSGFWLIAGLVLAALVGVCSAQYIKDRLTGVPAPLRTAISATETAALAAYNTAQAKLVNEVHTLVSEAAAKVASATASKPVAAALKTAAATPAPVVGASGSTTAPAPVPGAVGPSGATGA